MEVDNHGTRAEAKADGRQKECGWMMNLLLSEAENGRWGFREGVLSKVVTPCKGEPRMSSGSFSVMGVSQAGTCRMVETEMLGNGGVSKASQRSRAQISE